MFSHPFPSQYQELQDCIQDCVECHHVCTETYVYCLQKGGEHADPTYLRLLLDCAEIAQTAANFMIRGSNYSALTCDVCRDICQQCEAASTLLGDDSQIAECVEACRHCTESCLLGASEALTRRP